MNVHSAPTRRDARDNFRVLHVEDSDDSAFLVQRALVKAGFRPPDRRLDGVEAIEFLSMAGLEELPDVILLDLHMPRKGGLEVLQWTHTHPPCHTIPIFMLTSSEELSDRQRAESLGAAGFLRKDGTFQKVVESLEKILEAKPKRPSFRQSIPLLHDGMDRARKEIALMAEHTGERVVLLDRHGRIEWVSSEYARRCDSTLEEWRGRDPEAILLRADDPATSRRRMLQALAAAAACECEISHHGKDGSVRPAIVSLGPVIAEGELRGFIALERDRDGTDAAPLSRED